MGDFSADWLTLRESQDQHSRNILLTERLIAWRKTFPGLTIVDLGTGTGSNVRYLLPKLKGQQAWFLIDKDQDLLNHLRPRMAQWAQQVGLQLTQTGDALFLQGDDSRCRLTNYPLDLADGLAQCPQKPDLITASAFLDLVSSAWVDKLAMYCKTTAAAFFVALTYNGTIRWEPADEDDEWIRHGVNGHQRTDKGFGPALGPEGASYTAACFEDCGYQVYTKPSDWQLGINAKALQLALATGYADAVQQQEPAFAARVKAWLGRRQRIIEASQSRLTIGHVDLFAHG